MSVHRLVRLATATSLAGASWLALLLIIVESSSTTTSVIISICTLMAAGASLWFLGILLERDDGETFRIGGDATLRAQVAVTRALGDAAAGATRADLFALLAREERPLSIRQLDLALAELERAEVVASDFDDECGERVYRRFGGRRAISTSARVWSHPETGSDASTKPSIAAPGSPGPGGNTAPAAPTPGREIGQA